MLTATASLARRVELAESALVFEMGRSVAARLGESQVIATGIAGGAAVMPGPGSPLSKVAGLGFEPLDEDALDAVERAFARFQTPVRVELSSLADPTVGKRLSARGYVLAGFENVLGLSLPSTHAATPRPPSGTIVEAAAVNAAEWVEVVTTGFAHPDSFDGPPSAEPVDAAGLDMVFEDLSRVDGFSAYLARREGQPAGGASMRIHKGVAQLCGASTLPAYRRMGVQTTLLHERLADAAHAGCDIAIVTTEPGSKSQENVQRQGFELLYVRAVLIKQP